MLSSFSESLPVLFRRWKTVLVFSVSILTLIPGGLIVNAQAASSDHGKGGVDLHAHLFMKEGMSWIFHGDFNHALQATSWTDKFKSKVGPDTLEDSGMKVVVVSLYAHPLMNISLRQSIHDQIDMAEAFVKARPEWVIAKSAAEAQWALSAGKRVLVLSLETAAGILENEEDLKTFIDARGIRIVTLLHLTADHYGGVSFQKGIKGFASPLDFMKSLVAPRRDANGIRVNDVGLSAEGRKMTEALIRRHVWIDLCHASDEAQKGLIPLLKEAGQPLLYTHTSARHFYEAERVISDEQLEQVRETHGLVGLFPSEDMLDDVGPGVCKEGVGAMAEHYRYLASKIGADSVMLGSDINAPLTGLRANACNEKPFVNYGDLPALWQALRKAGAPVPENLDSMTRRFLQAWTHVKAQ
ncbi:MAG: membrane dipeptidase [Methylotenera sp.]|nr:membrane dipeptidase [Oligoflexia bacterium]